MASSAFVPLIFSVFFFLFLCKAQDIDQKSKSALVEAVFKKVFNLTLASFANIPIEEREKMMDKIELKLKKSAESLDYKSGKYVALIMEGIKSITSENILTNNVDDIFTSSSEDHDKKESIEKQKNKDALEQAMIRTMKKTAEINKVNQSNTKKNEARRMEFKFIDTISVNKVPKDHEDENAEPKNNEPLNEFNTRNGNGIEYVFKDSSNKIDFKNVTFKSPCYVKNNITCLKIKALRTIKCNSKEISIEKLCNGIKDCFDYSDERDCAMQGVDKVRNASQIMSDIEQSLEENCYTAKMNDSILAEQHEILRNVLQNQIKFIEKHGNVKVTTYSPHSYLRNFYSEPKNVMKAVNEVAAVVTKLSSALENTLCSSTVEEELYQKANDIYHDLQRNLNSEPMTTSAWAPITCSCKKDYCVGKCPEQCFTICLQRYYLDRWQCKAVAAQNTISLDLICDGKFDCFDEADEKGCSAGAVSGFAKFEARKMYSLILDMISTKVQSTNFDKVRYKLINLQKQIEKLQILTTKRKVNPLEVKILRDICFSEMKAIYEQTRFYAPSMDLIYDIYSFLLSVNLKLVSAMMYSHTGNVRIIDSDGCFCRDSKCVLPVCSKTCNNTCLAEPKLTRYFCGGHKAINQSKPIEAICDGKDDCPDKDDEMDCSKDICRKHHLILLSHKLQEAVERNSDTTFGEALLTWNEKVSATLLDTQAYGRPTPAVLRDVIRHMLYDLTLSYGHLASTMRRSNDGIIDHFSKIALIVMSSLKTCAK